MAEDDEKKGRLFGRREEPSGTAGLERTSGTSSTSTGVHERTGVAPAMPDTGNLHYGNANRNVQRPPPILELGSNTGVKGINTTSSHKQRRTEHVKK